jgi:hypothetical protein
MGQVYQCWWGICREINVFPRFEYHTFYVLYPFVTYLLAPPPNIRFVFSHSVTGSSVVCPHLMILLTLNYKVDDQGIGVTFPVGQAVRVAQAVSRWLPTAAARVRTRV